MPDEGKAAVGTLVYQPQQCFAIHMVRYEIPKLLQLRLAGGGEGRFAGTPVEAALPGHPEQQSTTESVGFENAVPGGTERRTFHAAFCVIAGIEERFAPVSPDSPVVDLIPGYFRVPETGSPSLRAPQDLLVLENCLHGQETEPEGFCLSTLHAVLDESAEHLVAAADTQHGQATLRPFGEGLLEAAGVEQFQVLKRRFGTREDGEIGVE